MAAAAARGGSSVLHTSSIIGPWQRFSKIAEASSIKYMSMNENDKTKHDSTVVAVRRTNSERSDTPRFSQRT